ncbi:hypothetical protein FB45DRAFT_1039072 [Roridomyces roridus]|uniref:Uncharacterized protein n=1 Tax=Roridomyces roridus TaxID=1738132 RepID=A0AAD7F8S6_9AGAR|nr:hypothetical protein FB45DRAFT_1039072 [Roridomyces roridus]
MFSTGAGHSGQPSIFRAASNGSASGRSSPLSLPPLRSSSSAGTSRHPTSSSPHPIDFPNYWSEENDFSHNGPHMGSPQQAYVPASPLDGRQGGGVTGLLEMLLTEVRALRVEVSAHDAKLDSLATAIQNVGGNPSHAAWIRAATAGYSQLPVMTEGSPALAQRQQEFPGVTNWLRPTESSSSSIVAPADKHRRAFGRQNIALDVNTTAPYLQDDNGNVIGGKKLDEVYKALRGYAVDLEAAGMMAGRVNTLGLDAKAALIYQLEHDFSFIGHCTEHWKANELLKAKYRDVRASATGTKRGAQTQDGGKRKRQAPNPVDDPVLIQMPDPTAAGSEIPPSPAGNMMPLSPPTSIPTTQPPPVSTQTTTTTTSTQTTSASQDDPPIPPPPPAGIQTTPVPAPPANPVRSSILSTVRVSPPSPPAPAPAPVPANSSAPPAEVSGPKTNGRVKAATAHKTHITARNIYLAIYAADVGGSTTDFPVHFQAVPRLCPAFLEACDKYAQELKSQKIKQLPAIDTIRAALGGFRLPSDGGEAHA